MTPESSLPSPEAATAVDAALLRDQREANEKLVLATILAQEAADSARHAQEDAEHAVGAMQESVEELRSVAEFRERLIGIVGHDLRSPLNTMLMASGLLLAHGQLSESDGRLVNRIVNSGQRMARMISQLLDFTRAKLGGAFPLVLEKTDLGDVCRNIVEELGLGSKVEIHLTADGDLAGKWDSDRLAEAISNIASNALEHAAPGSAVDIRVQADGPAVTAEITNHGPTIPPELLPVIFKAFRGAEVDADPYRRAGHMGLGLYISSEIVRLHGGTLEVQSADGTTSFTVRLPRVPPPPPSKPVAA